MGAVNGQPGIFNLPRGGLFYAGRGRMARGQNRIRKMRRDGHLRDVHRLSGTGSPYSGQRVWSHRDARGPAAHRCRNGSIQGEPSGSGRQPLR